MENYQTYKSWLQGINSTGNKPEFNAESDAKVKKFVTTTIGGDDILRKMMMLNFVTDGIIDKEIANLYALRRLVKNDL